jgi:prepilin-type N-terminal cleavage/methylation domain-containing protein
MIVSLPSAHTLKQPGRSLGFTLTELAVVLAIVGLLLGGLMYTLSAQVETRNFSGTQRLLEEARELVLAYAVVNGRLPCPATISPSTNGAESITTPAAPGTGGTCSAYYDGYLPAATIGFNPTDASGFALDTWGNRIRYAVSQTGLPHFTSNAAIKSNWSTTSPADIDVCKRVTAPNAASCASAADRLVTNGTVVAVIWSQGKNFAASGAASNDESANNDASSAFVSRTPSPAGAPDGEFDDQMAWIPIGMLYGRLIASGSLP